MDEGLSTFKRVETYSVNIDAPSDTVWDSLPTSTNGIVDRATNVALTRVRQAESCDRTAPFKPKELSQAPLNEVETGAGVQLMFQEWNGKTSRVSTGGNVG